MRLFKPFTHVLSSALGLQTVCGMATGVYFQR